MLYFSSSVIGLSYGLAFLNHNVLQAMEIRKALDAYFIEELIDKLTAADIDELSEIVQRMLNSNADAVSRTQADYAFHAFNSLWKYNSGNILPPVLLLPVDYRIRPFL